ncbi:hypothetical protein [Pseudomonas chlororaphis]|uniref:hypothetical protein n=1 Tax=Pseudomonas chlororaphis TaxID=587753 RepID=UPI003462F730
MNDDLMRLPDLVSEYARYYEVDTQEAAHALHELIKELYLEYSVRQGKVALPDHIFWVGRVGSSQRSNRIYKLFFEGLIKYFDDLCDPLPGIDKDLVRSYCESDSSTKDIPVGLIYLSRVALGEWILDAGIEPPDYMLIGNADKGAKGSEGGEKFQAKELGSISLILNGLINLIKEVDKAHTEQPLDDASGKRADTIKRRALGLRSVRKNFDPCLAILSLAEAAEVEMPKSHKTLRKFMKGHFQGDEG